MSKRSATADLSLAPTKLAKINNVWSIIPDDDDQKSKSFKPVEGGPKTKLCKTFILNYNPKLDVTITLNGSNPEVRFTGQDGCFYLSGEEFLDISGVTQCSNQSLDEVRLEPLDDGGFRLARYRPTESGMPALFPLSVLEMNKYAAKRLKTKLEQMCDHVNILRESEGVIRVMYDCIVDAYKAEYQLADSLLPITDQFFELSRIVETYVTSVSVVRAFNEKLHEKKLVSCFNHYHLHEVASSQRHFVFDLLK